MKHTEICLETIRQWNGILAEPAPENRKHQEGIPVFENRFMEKVLARSHVLLPGLWFLPVLAWTLYRALGPQHLGVATTAGYFTLGVLIWSLLEYFLHRYLFHMASDERFESKFRSFMIHGYHHEFPNDKWRLVAPPLMSWPLAVVIGWAYWVALDQAWTATFAGTLVGYLSYDWIHYYTHHARPTTRLGKFLRRYHMEHHYKDPSSHFGISNPLWDVVFGTYDNAQQRAPETPASATSAQGL